MLHAQQLLLTRDTYHYYIYGRRRQKRKAELNLKDCFFFQHKRMC